MISPHAARKRPPGGLWNDRGFGPMPRESAAESHRDGTMTTATPYGNGVGAIIQSMFARAKNLWVPPSR